MDQGCCSNGVPNGIGCYEPPSDDSYTYILRSREGEGSFGVVRTVNSKYKPTEALIMKCCRTGGNGISNLYELAIMTTIIHPYISNACDEILMNHKSDQGSVSNNIQNNDFNMLIPSARALGDIKKLLTTGFQASVEQRRQWCWQLVQAVALLHCQCCIIHCDIKGSNILLYPDNTVKLTDMGLSVKKWKTTSSYNHKVCTCTHRPLECLLGLDWCYSLDIWSLAVTFVEIYYNVRLFPNQDALEVANSSLSADSRIQRLHQRSINCLLDWFTNGPYKIDQDVLRRRFSVSMYPIRFIEYCKIPTWDDPINATFNHLIVSMLHPFPEMRPTILQVAKYPFFVTHPLYPQLPTCTYEMRTVDINHELLGRLEAASRLIHNYTDDQLVRNVAIELYKRSAKLTQVAEGLKIYTLTYIATKLVNGSAPMSTLPLKDVLITEMIICRHLNFLLL